MKPITVACKTGTAESFGDGSEPHAWFTVFAPAENPEIVLTVMAEEAGEGSEVAAPIAKEILTDYFERKKR
jgi:cell division protein FtsI/penicillin-binding protein 2